MKKFFCVLCAVMLLFIGGCTENKEKPIAPMNAKSFWAVSEEELTDEMIQIGEKLAAVANGTNILEIDIMVSHGPVSKTYFADDEVMEDIKAWIREIRLSPTDEEIGIDGAGAYNITAIFPEALPVTICLISERKLFWGNDYEISNENATEELMSIVRKMKEAPENGGGVMSTTVSSQRDPNGEAEKKYLAAIKEACATDAVGCYINGNPIYMRDILKIRAAHRLEIEKYMELSSYKDGEKDPFIAKYKKTDEQLLWMYIQNRIMVLEADKAGITLDNNAVREAYLKNLDAGFESIRTWLEACAQAEGLTLAQYRQRMADDALEREKRARYIEMICPLADYDNDFDLRQEAVDKKMAEIMKNYEIEIVE